MSNGSRADFGTRGGEIELIAEWTAIETGGDVCKNLLVGTEAGVVVRASIQGKDASCTLHLREMVSRRACHRVLASVGEHTPQDDRLAVSIAAGLVFCAKTTLAHPMVARPWSHPPGNFMLKCALPHGSWRKEEKFKCTSWRTRQMPSRTGDATMASSQALLQIFKEPAPLRMSES
jgi:hypothetical protein